MSRLIVLALLTLTWNTTWAQPSDPAPGDTTLPVPTTAPADAGDDESDPNAPAGPPPIEGREGRQRTELSLDEAIRIALARNLDLQLEILNAYQTHQDIGIASAAFDPVFATTYSMSNFRQPTVDTLSGLGSTTQILVNPFTAQQGTVGFNGLFPLGTRWRVEVQDSRSDNPESGFFGFNPRNSTTITAGVTQPLLKDFGYDVNLADLRIARENDAVAIEQLRLQTETVMGSVVDAYWNLYFAYRDLEVKLSALKEAEQLLEINQGKLDAGLAKEVDVTQARASIANQNSEIIQAENAISAAQDTLLDLLNYNDLMREQGTHGAGRALYEHLELILTTPLIFEEYRVDLEDAIALALEERSDLRQAYHAIQSAQHGYERAKHQVLPTLNLDATWNQLGLEENIGNSFDELFTGRYYSWTVAVNFEYAIGNRAARNERLKSQAALERAHLDFERLRNLAILEVSSAVREIKNAYRTVLARQEQVRLQRDTLDGERERLRVGVSTSFQVLEIQNDLLEAQSQDLRARVDYQNAITAYLKAVGLLRNNFGPERRP
ncbi:MAG: TolC family protein [Planctomycetota bacterium]